MSIAAKIIIIYRNNLEYNPSHILQGDDFKKQIILFLQYLIIFFVFLRMASHWAFPVSLWDPCLHVVTPHPGSRTVRRLPRIPGIQPGTATRSLKQRGADWLHGAAMITEAASNYLSKIIAVSDREAGRGWDEWGCPAGDSTQSANRLNPPRWSSPGTGRMLV